jgi:hypothetical protein
MKYLIVKGGLCGFGDRLESLKMYIKFALKHNLQIYVDWEDPVWSHNGETFYTYFDLINIKKLKSLDDIPANATVYPAVWKNRLKLPYTKEFAESNPITDLGYMQDQDYKADVVVCTSNGMRYFYELNNNAFFCNVFRVIDQRIISKVKERQQKYDLKNKVGVHLRGTDRASKINRSQRMTVINCQMFHAGLLNGVKFIAVSDDSNYISTWKARYKDFPVISDVKLNTGNKGTHLLSKDELRVPKDLLNVDLIVDFFTLASCSGVLSTSRDSRFANEARRLHNFIDKILSRTS